MAKGEKKIDVKAAKSAMEAALKSLDALLDALGGLVSEYGYEGLASYANSPRRMMVAADAATDALRAALGLPAEPEG